MEYNFIIINNYTDSCRDDLNNSSIGASKIKFNADNNGVITSCSDKLVCGVDGRYITLPLDTPKDFLVVKDIKKIDGNTSKVTITYSDDSTEVVETE